MVTVPCPAPVIFKTKLGTACTKVALRFVGAFTVTVQGLVLGEHGAENVPKANGPNGEAAKITLLPLA
jgi:hypothetical protein